MTDLPGYYGPTRYPGARAQTSQSESLNQAEKQDFWAARTKCTRYPGYLEEFRPLASAVATLWGTSTRHHHHSIQVGKNNKLALPHHTQEPQSLSCDSPSPPHPTYKSLKSTRTDMVRPRASQRNHQLSVLFANIVTTTASLPRGPLKDTIGRKGPHSLFEVLSKVCPSATRDRSRDGVSEVEYNKALEKDGFQRVRVRFRESSQQLTEEESEGASVYRFAGRRWRNPDDSDDMAALVKAWPLLSEIVACSLMDAVQILREAIVAEAALFTKTKRRPTKVHRKTTPAPVFSSAEAQLCRMPMQAESMCSEADTDERSLAS
eukprot:1242912-Rhodomonas_salina.1